MKHFLSALTACAMLSGAASASTLSITNAGGLSLSSIPSGFGVLQDASGDAVSNPIDLTPDISLFNGDAFASGDGLFVDTLAQGQTLVTFTYVGFEAAHQNTSTNMSVGSGFFDTRASLTGQTAQYLIETGGSALIDLTFGSSGGDTCASITNGAAVDDGSQCQLAFSSVFNDGQSVYAMLGDGGGDSDLDDIVLRIDVEAVPLPAGGALMLTALAGFAAARRRKKA